jgi:DNA-binding transcriptional ArsR family regulator
MAQTRDRLFRTLADPTRRAIFERLCQEGDLTVTTMTADAGISQPAVSKHIRIMKEAGLVFGHSHGRETHYRANVAALSSLTDWVQQMTGFWEQGFDKLEVLLTRMDQ